MRTFIAKHQKTGLKITLQYGFSGVLTALNFDGEWKAEQVAKVTAKFPTTTELILNDIKRQLPESAWIFAEASDISFKNFYGRYPNKKGPKEVTEKAWNKLSDADKMEAILFIPILINQKSDGTAFPYPATYLNKKYWK